ncbi:MAG: hypothetical protein JO101_06930 [Candidatus Eremiobacteraeota bacterium]|nr:hypothetical protein [Candidatus Eremiobacteraeota bacterium]
MKFATSRSVFASQARSREVRSPTNHRAPLALLLLSALVVLPVGGRAARPLLDTHQLDGVFALFAPDVSVPWKRVSVKLDTYSGAPVDFAAYEADPAEVLIAGSTRLHALNTSARRPVARWHFTPPPGYKFESNDVEVPLANREGFFVIEARRGEAAQQTWLNLTRLGLVSKETPQGWVLYATDVRSGQPLRGMRVALLVGSHFVYATSDAQGIVHGVRDARFALAAWGHSRSFVSLSPQPPLPAAVVGVRTDRGVVRAGGILRFVGFARKRVGTVLHPMSGEVHVSAVSKGQTIASQTVPLGESGGFSGDLVIPPQTPAGDVAILASAGGAVGGGSVHIDAAGDLTLSIAPPCEGTCAPNADIPLRIAVRSAATPAAGQPVAIRVVRTPHVAAPGEAEDAERWGTTTVLHETVRSGADGIALVTLRAPQDGLSSTYGVTAVSGNATATTRIVVPNAAVVVTIDPERAAVDVGQPATFLIRGFDAVDGRPASGRAVHVKLTKGPTVQEQTVELDAEGRARATFRAPLLGTNVASAELAGEAGAFDATAVTVAPQALGARALARNAEVSISLDKPRYKIGERVAVTASLPGAVGSALVTLEGARVADVRVVPTSSGRASASLSLANATGDVRVGVAFVRDGAVWTNDVPIAIDGPGYPRVTALSADRDAYPPGAIAHILIHDGEKGTPGAFLAIRVSDGLPTGGAEFDDAPAMLAAGGTTTQNPASDDPSWHAYVQPAGSKAIDVFAGERPRASLARDDSLAVSAPRALLWSLVRGNHETLDVPLPNERGRYVVSVLKIGDGGEVGAASLAVSVQ